MRIRVGTGFLEDSLNLRDGLGILNLAVGLGLLLQSSRSGARLRDVLLDRQRRIGRGVPGRLGESALESLATAGGALGEEAIGDLGGIPSWYVPSR